PEAPARELRTGVAVPLLPSIAARRGGSNGARRPGVRRGAPGGRAARRPRGPPPLSRSLFFCAAPAPLPPPPSLSLRPPRLHQGDGVLRLRPDLAQPPGGGRPATDAERFLHRLLRRGIVLQALAQRLHPVGGPGGGAPQGLQQGLADGDLEPGDKVVILLV